MRQSAEIQELDAPEPEIEVRLSSDLLKAAATLTKREVRYLVDVYYQIQNDRIRAAHQRRQMEESAEPNALMDFFADQYKKIEGQIKRALGKYSEADEIGQWMRSIMGIGPVIASGLMAHIDITHCLTVGHIWSFAGLNPTAEWKKGQRRPWNARLKVICWKAGESFVKVHNRDADIYGHVYAERKRQEIRKNEAGDFADQAAAILQKRNFKKDTEAKKHYEAGHLPPAHIHARAKRYAVKLFLSHLHDVMYRREYGKAPPLPYPIAFGGHVHMIEPPGVAAP